MAIKKVLLYVLLCFTEFFSQKDPMLHLGPDEKRLIVSKVALTTGMLVSLWKRLPTTPVKKSCGEASRVLRGGIMVKAQLEKFKEERLGIADRG